jgi:hypothetical protein
MKPPHPPRVGSLWVVRKFCRGWTESRPATLNVGDALLVCHAVDYAGYVSVLLHGAVIDVFDEYFDGGWLEELL